MWQEFEDTLGNILLSYPPRTTLIISNREYEDIFIQFAGFDGTTVSEGLIIELSHGQEERQFTREQASSLKQLGFTREKLSRKLFIWRMELPGPIEHQDITGTVQGCTMRLRYTNGAPRQAKLQYQAWREPAEHSFFKKHHDPDPGENNIRFHSLEALGIVPQPENNS